ncbi:hypothetical protein B0H11DRAFT_2290307 [Mycena galericulata]|nr:hypothetical protein B0H11DRAFT_2290307 [Mycena galericulata]
MPVERTRGSRRTGADGKTQLVWTQPAVAPTGGIAFATNLTPEEFAPPAPPHAKTEAADADAPPSFFFFDPPAGAGAGPTPSKRASHKRKPSPPVPASSSPASSPTSPAPTGPHIPRPPNAFILFRSAFIRSGAVPPSSEPSHATLSAIAGLAWGALPPDVRGGWHERARKAREEHGRRFPGYAFRPKRGGAGAAAAAASSSLAEKPGGAADNPGRGGGGGGARASPSPSEPLDAAPASWEPAKRPRTTRETLPPDPARCAHIASLLLAGRAGSALEADVRAFDAGRAREVATGVELRWDCGAAKSQGKGRKSRRVEREGKVGKEKVGKGGREGKKEEEEGKETRTKTRGTAKAKSGARRRVRSAPTPSSPSFLASPTPASSPDLSSPTPAAAESPSPSPSTHDSPTPSASTSHFDFDFAPSDSPSPSTSISDSPTPTSPAFDSFDSFDFDPAASASAFDFDFDFDFDFAALDSTSNSNSNSNCASPAAASPTDAHFAWPFELDSISAPASPFLAQMSASAPASGPSFLAPAFELTSASAPSSPYPAHMNAFDSASAPASPALSFASASSSSHSSHASASSSSASAGSSSFPGTPAWSSLEDLSSTMGIHMRMGASPQQQLSACPSLESLHCFGSGDGFGFEGPLSLSAQMEMFDGCAGGMPPYDVDLGLGLGLGLGLACFSPPASCGGEMDMGYLAGAAYGEGEEVGGRAGRAGWGGGWDTARRPLLGRGASPGEINRARGSGQQQRRPVRAARCLPTHPGPLLVVVVELEAPPPRSARAAFRLGVSMAPYARTEEKRIVSRAARP